jgi:hypothetical protein
VDDFLVVDESFVGLSVDIFDWARPNTDIKAAQDAIVCR